MDEVWAKKSSRQPEDSQLTRWLVFWKDGKGNHMMTIVEARLRSEAIAIAEKQRIGYR